MITNPFAEVPDDVESVIAIVNREAREECERDAYPVSWRSMNAPATP